MGKSGEAGPKGTKILARATENNWNAANVESSFALTVLSFAEIVC